MTPAEVLTAAADKLDARAGEATPGRWIVWEGPERSLVCTMADLCTCGGGFAGYGHEPGCGLEEPPGIQATREDARFIATMNPLVGKALAEWLRAEGLMAAELVQQEGFVSGHALALARLIVGRYSS